MIITYPVKIEAYEDGIGIFTVEAMDEFCATITITSPMNVSLWREVSARVEEALALMFPEESLSE